MRCGMRWYELRLLARLICLLLQHNVLEGIYIDEVVYYLLTGIGLVEVLQTTFTCIPITGACCVISQL